MAIRILHIIESISSGGVERRRLLLAKYLPKAEFEQKIVCTTVRGPVIDSIRDQGVEVFPLGKFGSILSITHYREIAGIIATYRPHIIHGAVFEGVTMAAVSGILNRVPVTILEETSDPQNRRWTGNLLLRALSTTADFVVAISPSVEGYLIKNGISRKKVRLIPNGVDIPSAVPDAQVLELRAQLGFSDTDFIVGTVGRLRDFHKRFSDLIKAVAIVREKIPVKLLIIGDGHDRAALEELATDLGVANLVKFVGYQFDTSPYYACMNLFSLASHMEGFGLVVIEAMLSKVPVVVTNVGGLRDIVTEGDTGFFVQPHAPDQFASSWVNLYRDKLLRDRIAENAYAMARSEFTSEAYIDKVIRLYREATKTLT